MATITLTQKTRIYIHIFNIDGDDFQWFTHPRTFQILKDDTFDTVRKKIINKLSVKYSEEQASIIECLNQSETLSIFIDKVEDDPECIFNMRNEFKKIKSEITLNNNVWNTIKTNVPRTVESNTICIWVVAKHNINQSDNNNDINDTNSHINKRNKSNNSNNICYSNTNKRNNTNNNRYIKPKKCTNNKARTVNANINVKTNEIKRKNSNKKPKKRKIKTKSIAKKRRPVTDYNKQSISQTIRPHVNSNSNNKKTKIGLKHRKKHPLMKPIKSNVNRNRNAPELRDMTSLSKQIKNIKYKTIKKSNKKRKRMDKCEQVLKKQKKQSIIDWNAECIWLLIDVGPTMDAKLFYNSNKIECVRSLMEEMIKNNWSKEECITNHLRLFTFANELNDITKEPIIRYSNQAAMKVMNEFDECIQWTKKGNIAYENCMSYKNALSKMIECIVYEKQNVMNLKHPLLNKNRIILLTDAERGNIHIDIDAEGLRKKLKRYGIVLDAIQVCNSQRKVPFLEELCTYDNVGKYWNPITKTLDAYMFIMKMPMMRNVKLRDLSKNNSVICL